VNNGLCGTIGLHEQRLAHVNFFAVKTLFIWCVY